MCRPTAVVSLTWAKTFPSIATPTSLSAGGGQGGAFSNTERSGTEHSSCSPMPPAACENSNLAGYWDCTAYGG